MSTFTPYLIGALLSCAMIFLPAPLLAGNPQEIVGQWEWEDFKVGTAYLTPNSKRKLRGLKRFFDGKGGIRDRGSLVNTGSYKFTNEQTLEITSEGKTVQWKVRIVRDSMVLTGMDRSMKVEEKWKRVK